jgi:hypothetical protein
MFNFEYEIKKEEDGKIYVSPNKDQIEHPEHKFMAIEITRYLLNSMLQDNVEAQELEPQTVIEIAKAGNILEQISEKIGLMIVEQNNAMDELGLEVKDE